MPDKHLISVQGSTASGKTAVAIYMAKHFKTEIISADSRQFYKELNIATAKPSAEELKEVKHHFINEFTILNPINASDFETLSLKFINEYFKYGNILIITGGSGMYMDAVIKGFNPIPDVDINIKKQLLKDFNEKGLQILLQELESTDPEYYNIVDKKNPRRVLRALEIFLSSGKPYSYFLKLKKPERNFSVIKIGLALSSNELYDRIDRRCDEMLEKGLLNEAKKLYPYRLFAPLQTIGYSEFFSYIEGKCSLDFAKEKFIQHTRNYAKKQLTWLRRDKEIQWFRPGDLNEMIEFIERKRV